MTLPTVFLPPDFFRSPGFSLDETAFLYLATQSQDNFQNILQLREMGSATAFLEWCLWIAALVCFRITMHSSSYANLGLMTILTSFKKRDVTSRVFPKDLQQSLGVTHFIQTGICFGVMYSLQSGKCVLDCDRKTLVTRKMPDPDYEAEELHTENQWSILDLFKHVTAGLRHLI